MSSRKAGILISALTVVATTFGGFAIAHHSGAQWNLTKRVSVQGKVQSVVFRNPHGTMEVVAKGPGGKSVTWHVETSAVNLLMRRGWKPGRIKIGEVVTVTGHLKKIPGNDLYLREVRLADGTVFGDPTGNDKQLD
jgi:Family of unknown function (DUF6152)